LYIQPGIAASSRVRNGTMIGSEWAEASASRVDDAAAVEQAKGLLMEWFGVSADRADDVIRAWAGRCGRPPEVVAEVFVRQIWQGDATGCDRAVARALEHALRDLPRTDGERDRPGRRNHGDHDGP
jgi:hypothetical protein